MYIYTYTYDTVNGHPKNIVIPIDNNVVILIQHYRWHIGEDLLCHVASCLHGTHSLPEKTDINM